MAKDSDMKVMYRLHPNDKKLMIKLLDDMNWSIQKFGLAVTDAFLRGDPHLLKALKDWETLNEIPKDQIQNYTLSQRERMNLLAQIEEQTLERK